MGKAPVVSHHRVLTDTPVATLSDYLERGGGTGYEHALTLDPTEVVDHVAASGLRGRGGAGFPTGTKWSGVRETAADTGATTYVVCNAAEGEPGTFKDRTLLSQNPYAVLEGMLIAMHAVGAEHAFIGIKEKFTGPVQRVVDARDELAAAGWRRAEAIAVAPGPDEYLFGEEKALLEVIEGKLPLPRILPPYQTGLFATMTQPNPTVVNNVESFAHVTSILANGPDWFRELGTDASPGTMIFTVVGDVGTPGVWELPLGMPLRALITDIADGHDIKAVFGGTSNTVITPSLLDTPLDFDAMRQAGTGLGSGGFVVYDSSRCIVAVLCMLARFLAIESCGQCLACKLGTAELHELLEKIERGEGDAADLEAIDARTQTVTDLARCYLPTGAQLMIASTLQAYEDEFVAHLGTPCHDDRDVPTPLIEAIREDTGQVTFDPRYHLKRTDWSYAEG